MPSDFTARGLTPRELARILRVSADRIRSWIMAGELGAINTASSRCGRPRFVVLPHHLAAWERSRQAGRPEPEAQRRRRAAVKDYYPD